MKNIQFSFFALLLGLVSVSLLAQEVKYPPLSEYMMSEDREVALAKSAAPKSISDRATVKVLTMSGYRTIHEGNNGFVCVVLRGFSAPTFTPAPLRSLVYDPKTLAPICFNPQAVKTVLPYYELRTKLGIEGKTPDQIAERVQAAYKNGLIPKRDRASFAYMWSADQVLGPFNHWHPHMMVFVPNYDNSMLGGNEPGGLLPFLSDDAGTPFAVGVIPVNQELAIKAEP